MPNGSDANSSLAVLIDADNANPAIMQGLLAEVAKLGLASVKRIYGDWTTPNLASWKTSLLEFSIQPIQQFRYTTGKNATDSAMIIDAMDLLYEDVQTYLRPTYKLLEKIHPLNDGQLLFIDQLIPGSTLLGYVNADHWTIAIPVKELFSKHDPALNGRDRQLRDVLFEAMVLFLAEDLNSQQ